MQDEEACGNAPTKSGKKQANRTVSTMLIGNKPGAKLKRKTASCRRQRPPRTVRSGRARARTRTLLAREQCLKQSTAPAFLTVI